MYPNFVGTALENPFDLCHVGAFPLNTDFPFLGLENNSLYGTREKIRKLMDEVHKYLLKWGDTTVAIQYPDNVDHGFGYQMHMLLQTKGQEPDENFLRTMNQSFFGMFLPILALNLVMNSVGNGMSLPKKSFLPDKVTSCFMSSFV